MRLASTTAEEENPSNCRKREVADASELLRGEERRRSVPLINAKTRDAPRAPTRVKGETRRAATRLNLAGPSKMKRLVPDGSLVATC